MRTHEDFYRTFTHLYDRFFPVSRPQVDTLVQLLGNVRLRRVLDIGCGSGGVALALRSRGWTVDGLDPSAEMIDLARRKAAEAPGGGRFRVGRMEELGVWSGDGGYGAVLCLGNTLAHAADLADVERTCAAMRQVLRPPAVCIVQGIDFDHVIQQRIGELPLIEAAGYRFRRRYGAVDGFGRIPFSISIEPTAAPAETMETETQLLALGERDVVAALAGAGFDSVRRSGSLSGSAETGGLELVVVAELSAEGSTSL